MIIKYRTFNSSEEFEQWQTENSVKVLTIQPLASTFGGPATDNEVSATISWSVFVTYVPAWTPEFQPLTITEVE